MKALNWKTAVGLAAVLAVAGALRLYEIGSKSLWLDEVYSEVRTRGDFRESMDEIVKHDAPPPSYLLALWFWRRGFGDSDAILRVLSACCDLATVALIFLLLRHLTGRAGAFAGRAFEEPVGVDEPEEFMSVRVQEFFDCVPVVERRGQQSYGSHLVISSQGAICA